VHGRHRSEIGVVEGGGDMGDEEVENDGVGGPTPLCCFPSSSRRYNRRKAHSFDCAEPGSAFSPVDTTDSARSGVVRPLRSLSVREFCCCCGPRRSGQWIVEVQKEHGSDNDRLRTAGSRWEVDVNDEYYFKPPMWKQLIRKMKAQAKHVHGSRNFEWLNYDPQSYEKNFDNGEFRQQYLLRSVNQKDDYHGARESSALHAALLHRFASGRSQQDATNPP
jgi:hypothetical protein